MDELVAHGASIDHQCARGRTAAIYAAENGNFVAVEWLLAHGADPLPAAQDGSTVLTAVCAHITASKLDDVALLETIVFPIATQLFPLRPAFAINNLVSSVPADPNPHPFQYAA